MRELNRMIEALTQGESEKFVIDLDLARKALVSVRPSLPH
jgi:hypothetical protein